MSYRRNVAEAGREHIGRDRVVCLADNRGGQRDPRLAFQRNRLILSILATFVAALALSSTAGDTLTRSHDVLGSVFAVIKLSYNEVGEKTVTGGICGTAFFVTQTTALTAHHFVNTKTCKPNDGFRKCQFWLAAQNGIVLEFDQSQLTDVAARDAEFITFKEPVSGVPLLDVATNQPGVGELVYNIGFVGGQMPRIDAEWKADRLAIKSVDLRGTYCLGGGSISRIDREVHGNDVWVSEATVLITSYGGREGMSGGPLMAASRHQVVGMMSSGWPPDSVIKTNVGAIWIGEIIPLLKK